MAKSSGRNKGKILSTRVDPGLAKTLEAIASRLPDYTVSDVMRWCVGFTIEHVFLGAVITIDDIHDPALKGKFQFDIREGLRNPDGSPIPGKVSAAERVAEIVSS